jgi:transposase-like protein
VSTSGSVNTKRPKRRQYSEALKRQMVAETQVPGASVSIVARRHDVNSNQLFRWRRQLLPKAAVESGAMVPVEIAANGDRPRRLDRDGIIEIVLAVVHQGPARRPLPQHLPREDLRHLPPCTCPS